MPRFTPFPGARYSPGLDPGTVTAPPYDVIDADERARLAGRHPANAVHVDLPVAPADGDPYVAARERLDEWIDDGTLVRDFEPVFYGYRMTFPGPSGETRRSTGVLGALDLSAPDQGELLPHEYTTPKARSDRLDLLRATEANLSAIWGLSPTHGLTEAIGDPTAGAPSWVDDDGIGHTYWVIDDPDRLASIAAAVAANPIVIADGHHRYETSLQHRDEQRASRGGDAGEADAAMFLVVELVADELTVLPIHRLVDLADGLDLAGLLSERFEIGEEVELRPELLDQMVGDGFLVLVEPDRARRLVPRPGAFEGLRDLDTVRVDAAIEGAPAIGLTYQHGIDHVAAAVAAGRADAGILVRPVTVEQIGACAEGGERMPPKSTFFHPKPRTGAVYRLLDR